MMTSNGTGCRGTTDVSESTGRKRNAFLSGVTGKLSRRKDPQQENVFKVQSIDLLGK